MYLDLETTKLARMYRALAQIAMSFTQLMGQQAVNNNILHQARAVNKIYNHNSIFNPIIHHHHLHLVQNSKNFLNPHQQWARLLYLCLSLELLLVR